MLFYSLRSMQDQLFEGWQPSARSLFCVGSWRTVDSALFKTNLLQPAACHTPILKCLGAKKLTQQCHYVPQQLELKVSLRPSYLDHCNCITVLEETAHGVSALHSISLFVGT